MKRIGLDGRILDAAGTAFLGATAPRDPWRRPAPWPQPRTLDTIPPPRHELLQALARISPEHREILVYKDVQGLSYAAVARRLGVPEDSVAERLFQARRAFLEPWNALRPATPVRARGTPVSLRDPA